MCLLKGPLDGAGIISLIRAELTENIPSSPQNIFSYFLWEQLSPDGDLYFGDSPLMPAGKNGFREPGPIR
jgi:hypothetical protein